MIKEIRTRAAVVRRLASVCSGAFLLATAGLLDGRRAATHWQRGAEFSARFPKVRLDLEPIFIRDGAIWTSAGVTAGIDLCLALVEDDLGHATALSVARQLVVFLKRPGDQAQFSAPLERQSQSGPFAVVFFGALFPQFIDPASPVAPQLLILGVTYIVVDGAILLLWGWLGIRAASALKQFSFGLINKVCGSLMIAAAALLATRDFQPQR